MKLSAAEVQGIVAQANAQPNKSLIKEWVGDQPILFTAEEAAARDAEHAAHTARGPVVPMVTNIQMRRALRTAGLLDGVNKAVNAMGDEAADSWEYATTIPRDDPLVAALADQLGYTEAQVDAIFLDACKR